MLGASLLVASVVVLEGALRRPVSWLGLSAAAALTASSVTGGSWQSVSLAALAFLLLIVLSSIRTGGDVFRAVCVAVLSVALAVQVPWFAVRLAYVLDLDARIAVASIASVCVGVSFAIARVGRDDHQLMPFAAVGAAALPLAYLPAALAWGAAGLAFLLLRPIGRAGALLLAAAAAAVSLAFVALVLRQFLALP